MLPTTARLTLPDYETAPFGNCYLFNSLLAVCFWPGWAISAFVRVEMRWEFTHLARRLEQYLFAGPPRPDGQVTKHAKQFLLTSLAVSRHSMGKCILG